MRVGEGNQAGGMSYREKGHVNRTKNVDQSKNETISQSFTKTLIKKDFKGYFQSFQNTML